MQVTGYDCVQLLILFEKIVRYLMMIETKYQPIHAMLQYSKIYYIIINAFYLQ